MVVQIKKVYSKLKKKVTNQIVVDKQVNTEVNSLEKKTAAEVVIVENVVNNKTPSVSIKNNTKTFNSYTASSIVKKENNILPESIYTLSKKIKFNFGKYNSTQDTYPILQSIVALMKKTPSTKYRLEGHTDSVGSFDYNRKLSKKRANAVRNYLIDSGISRDNLQSFELGESKPIDSNLTKEGRSNNRRIEIIEIK